MTLSDILLAAVEMVAIQAAIILPLGFVAHAWRVYGDAPWILRLRARGQAVRARVLPPRARVEVLGEDGAWAPPRDLKAEASERRAGKAIGWIVGSLIGGLFLMGVIASCTPS